MESIGIAKCNLGLEGARAMAELISVTASLTVTDMRYNQLDTESATMLANVAKEKGISLCGITPEQTEADFTPSKNNYNQMGLADAILLTADLAVRGSLMRLAACLLAPCTHARVEPPSTCGWLAISPSGISAFGHRRVLSKAQ